MSYNVNLYNELLNLRQKLKNKGKREQGRTPLVCNDEALYQMAQLCPKSLNDFKAISGIGTTFIENYGQAFLDVILKHTQTVAEKPVSMSSAASDTLKELEKKLVNINRRNRLLYMPKIAYKYAYDLYNSQQYEALDILKGKTVTLCDVTSASENEQFELIKYKRLTQLLREVNKDLRDKGQNDLYIGYPFVIGRLPGENFDVRAPLALFPVSAERTPTKIQISLDESRDIIYNNTLILAYFKFNNINKPLPTDTIDSYSAQNFINSLLSFYEDNGIVIHTNNVSLRSFSDYSAADFPRHRSGELILEPCVVLGKFPVCSSSIQKDFDEILEKNEINNLLNELLLNSEELDDFYADSYAGEQDVKTTENALTISEHNLLYINSLNSSQEAVLSAIKKLDNVVVQGPPGTGKSQTITSMIAEFAANGKTVLMVSEKKTALDVVYSRLGELSKYALLIDDVGNKDAFYKQLSKMIPLGQPQNGEEYDISGISDGIDGYIKRLEKIADKLYSPGKLGIETYKLYLKSKRIDFSDTEQKNLFYDIRTKRAASLMALSFSELEKTYHLFADTQTLDCIESFSSIALKYPWLSDIKGNMSEYDLITLEKKLHQIKDELAVYWNKNALVRLFSKGKVINLISNMTKEYFNSSEKDLLNFVFSNINSLIDGLDVYVTYQKLRPLYESLADYEKDYFSSINDIKTVYPHSLAEINDMLFNAILNEHIAVFEAENRELFHNIDNFNSIIHALSKAIAEKQKLTREKLASLLSGNIYNICTSKRHGEILHALESKRKKSVSKFLKDFSFELINNVKIWLLTPEVVSEIIPLEKGLFDLVVFDEASQMYVEKGIPAIYRAKKVVIAGDHKQLRPSSLGVGRMEIDQEELPEEIELTAALEEESLLDLARFKYKDILLNFHYRSKYEELIAFSNYAFYKGRLLVSPNSDPPENPPIEVYQLTNAQWRNRTNYEEAVRIVKLLKDFFEERKSNETVGIITFNSSQRDLIDDLIDEECAKDPLFATRIRNELNRRSNGEDIGLFVKNIESVQGDERDVIIFSIGYAKNENGRLVRNFGWLNQKGGENRLNVAISRAKKKIYIVTSFHPSELQVEDMKNDGPRILKKYLEYAFAVSRNDKENAKNILLSFSDDTNPGQIVSFDSDFENQVYDALVERGYHVETQIGIGGYSIDLAIKKDDKYILGIECDGRLYHSSKSARERDYHRQKYLESRGWKIHRIWSTNWWKNPQQEINKICVLVDNMK